MLAKSKLNSTETLISNVWMDSEISQEEHTTIINQEEKYGRIKGNIRLLKSDPVTQNQLHSSL